VARETISAVVDGEEPPIPETAARAHLSRCEACRDFEARVVSLAREMSVRALPPRPDCTTEMLTSLGFSGEVLATQDGREHAWWSYRRRLAFVRATQWTAGLAPLVLAVPALALGVFAHAHIVPSHELTPCMMSLAHRRR